MIKGILCIFCNAKTKWPYFQELLKTTLDNSIPKTDDITCVVESFNYTMQQPAWSATPTSNPDLNIE